MKIYLVSITMIIISSYSVYFIFNQRIVSKLGEEDQLFEWLTAFFLFLGSILFISIFRKTKNIFFLFLSVALFAGSGEEISWGQRIFNFGTPDMIKKVNVQGEFTLHNVEIFQGADFNGLKKKSFDRIFEINLLFRIFTILFGIILPLCNYHIKFIKGIIQKIKLPVPPLSLGIFFFLNWLIYWVMHTFYLPDNDELQFVDTAGEIFEFSASYILCIISLYFYIKMKFITRDFDSK